VSGNSIERLLDKIDADISDFLIFAGALDNNAKLISFRKGKASFSLPNERQDTLDVQMSLMFSLIRQFEDISGPHKFTVARFVRYDIFLFGAPDMHVFVLTLPTSESRVAKTLTEMVASFGEAETHLATPSFTSRNNDKTMAAALAPAPLQEPERQQKFSAKLRPEVITMLQGYLMALDPGCTIQEDAAGFYKIKASESDRLAWLTLEKISSTFKDRLNIDHIGTEANGGLFVRISLRQ
jgi:hypothetical protein